MLSMGNSNISMAIFNSFLYVYQRVTIINIMVGSTIKNNPQLSNVVNHAGTVISQVGRLEFFFNYRSPY
jgi:hypothetical protein